MRINLGKTLKTLALGSALATIATTGFAATQGTPGATSTGTVDISLAVSDQVRISGLSDIVMTFTGADAVGNSAACIYRNTLGGYTITATGDGAGSIFTLTDGATPVPYAVTYDDGSGATAMATGVVLGGQSGEDNDVDCANIVSGTNGTVEVTVAAAAAAALAAATYAGTLTLVVAPI